MAAKIVGCRYYNGHINPEEMVVLVREPHNQYDRNAIRVDNVRADQIGHIPRGVAAKLAPFMDDRSLMIEGATTGYKEVSDCPIALKLYGTYDPTAPVTLKERMRAAKLPLGEFNQREREEKAQVKAEQQREKERLKALKAARKGGFSMPDGQGGLAIPPGSGQWAGGASQGDDSSQTLDD